jgi:hypothetical protein
MATPAWLPQTGVPSTGGDAEESVMEQTRRLTEENHQLKEGMQTRACIDQAMGVVVAQASRPTTRGTCCVRCR